MFRAAGMVASEVAADENKGFRHDGVFIKTAKGPQAKRGTDRVASNERKNRVSFHV